MTTPAPECREEAVAGTGDGEETRNGGEMPLAPDKVYELHIFDVRIHGEAERFDRERTAWGDDAEVEMLDRDHPALIVRPGGALRLLR
jgi:hypothetical protein